MKWLMRKCERCSRYTLKTSCPACGSATKVPHPARFSPDDKYAKYRVSATAEDSETIRSTDRPADPNSTLHQD
ncbi:MAG TPA: RNA-protein complex protein Nop10 [Candidatus Bathyarchaeia archaeon]|nr:RNA-protein complex protein Nop10 [Candidatus Bathyarchaeia archaeon]